MKAMIWGAMALAAVALAAPAGATPAVGSGVPIVLTNGDQVTVNSRRQVATVVRTTAQPEVPPADRNATSEFMQHADRPPTMAAPTGAVRFTLWTNPREGARLKMENNSGVALIYSAEIVIAGNPRPQPTSICSIQPGHAGYELWSDPITAIRITGFYPAPAGNQVCGNAERGNTGAPPPNAPVAGPAPSRGGK